MNNLLITTVGNTCHASSWLDGGGFDVFLIDYTKNQTFKYPGIHDAIIAYNLLNYDYFWMPDEDVDLVSADINKMFEMMDAHNIDLAQPSILKASDSFPSWPRFIHFDTGAAVIPTDFVEVMCPVFSRYALKQCIDTFPRSLSGWGLDLAWSKILEGRNIAILNSVVAKHTRKISGGGLYDALKREGVRPSEERKRVMKEYGITEHSILNKDG